MKRRRVDVQIERKIITGMIVSDKVLREVQHFYTPTLLATPFTKTVAGWCNSYWQQYNKAPGPHIQDIFNSHVRKGLDAAQADLIKELLASISSEYERSEKFNADYLLDQAEEYFNVRNLKLLDEDLTMLLSEGNIAEAEEVITQYKKVARLTSPGINPLSDADAIREAFEEQEYDELFHMPGALGEFLGPFVRDSLTMIMGPEKRGKSFWLLELAMRAYRARCNVALFTIGDMSQNQQIQRIHAYNKQTSAKYSGDIKVPILDCERNQTNECGMRERMCDFGVMRDSKNGWVRVSLKEEPNYIPCTYCLKENNGQYAGAVWHEIRTVERLTWQRALDSGLKAVKRAGNKGFKFVVYPSRGINVAGIERQLDVWEDLEGFVADFVVVDYADNLAPEENTDVFRHRVNENWQALRGLGQKRHCGVASGTQADAASYDKRIIREINFSEDKRKYGHVTMVITLNQTPDEKADGTMRIGKMFVRDDDYNVNDNVTVLECRKICRPYLGSYFTNRGKYANKG